ncbi:bifunctional diaminohydroxyphosphoribosylaminopyrimidine deaminase/5-amino-6-(5-phosphoribosylamino)uracil reductase RibD [Patescibacteria group bacterium]|nr:bifunctional diaminohydroxyphosphoribosylaminopyrimidine deaminase/5-amino-6-(5-phosphoribosylamino)uracil reductase RibD [Patescibacteria group bacterium]MBU1673439.1 bifunctional diaminohydroxyphosphoribosylaminopyrimidine deaminase/5-amino-6-(5-phosphoribosylamino)uracil reductase RibD [Patescibacteria group bacterium]MBU1963360.1 bifunctional diaminohydroxyphosphoribosylaminopyrimidine deaminase/5-amino-6-(5-phosphoribosylamino)uracil reductase RibD [Patescibacteria group bacterium]
MTDQDYMKKAIQLANKAGTATYPNPLVGAILVKGGKIMGQGYHGKNGHNHAEVNAIENAKKQGHIITGATLYVTLEPCCHFGKTPPCVNAIIENKIKKVVIGQKDPNPIVCERGIKELRKNKIQVRNLNLKEVEILTRPEKLFVILKMGVSLDGRITHPKSRYISNCRSLEFVHNLRSSVDAILVGYNTYIKDKPKLTARIKGGRDPERFFLPKVHVDLKKFIKKIEKEGVRTLLVEGGKETATSFLNEKLVDKVYICITPEFFGSKQLDMFGKLDKIVKLKDIYTEKMDEDILISGYVKK